MGLTSKSLMGGDRMTRPGGVKTMQDEINEGLRDKSGREYSAKEIEENKLAGTKKAEEENTPAQEETTDAPPADDGAESSEASPSSEQQDAGPDTPKE